MQVRGQGRATFAAILLMIAGTLDVIYGIAAIGEAHFFTDAGTHFVFAGLNTWGWFTVIVGVIELTGGVSLLSGNAYGRVIGIAAASLGALISLLAVSGAYPFWSLGIFALCVIVLHGLIVYGEPVDDGRHRQGQG